MTLTLAIPRCHWIVPTDDHCIPVFSRSAVAANLQTVSRTVSISVPFSFPFPFGHRLMLPPRRHVGLLSQPNTLKNVGEDNHIIPLDYK